ncbi:hypothetical protein [Actinospica robiniae]|uniref:hypothetical protein n=1 Tax=Actinospica robiniae TaxID=304901 RepID=UPI0003F6A360|nr:hypothetical protein [Actinospica robiniae]
MNTRTEASACPPPQSGAPDPPAGVIARPGRYNEGWSGRYLHHAPGPSDTARLIRETVTARSSARTRMKVAVSELIDAHPCGWEHLGTATAKDPQIRARRRPADAGSCYCHTPDGYVRPEFLNQLLGMLRRLEQTRPYDIEALEKAVKRSSDPTACAPQLINPHKGLPDRVVYVFLLHAEGITVGVRDGARDARFLKAGEVGWSEEANWEQIDAAAAAIRARVPEDLARDDAGRSLTTTARHLKKMVSGQYALETLHWHARTGRETAAALGALARAAGVGPDELPDHLASAGLEAQADLFEVAAQLIPGESYRAV